MHASIIRISLFLFAAFLIFPAPLYRYTGYGMEASWQIALHEAWEKGRIFGVDFIFTYGPLGILCTRLPYPSSWPALLYFDFFFFTLIIGCAVYLLKRNQTLFGAFLCVLLAYNLNGTNVGPDIPIIGFFLILFFLGVYENTSSKISLLLALTLSILLLLMKFNFGLPAQLVVFSYLIYKTFSSGLVFKYGGCLLLYCTFLLAIPSLIPISLYDYIQTGLQLAIGHQDAMYFPLNDKSKLYQALFLISALWLHYGFRLFGERDNRVLALYVLFFNFLLFKQAFLRADSHVDLFFRFFPLIIVLLLAFAPINRIKSLTAFLALSIFSAFWNLPDNYSLDKLKNRSSEIKLYLTQARGGPIDDMRIHAESPMLPQEIINIVGKESVDIFPVDIGYLVHDGLNYQARPIPQSYVAYLPELDKRNADFLGSGKAPKYLIYLLFALDDRYAMFDEAATRLQIAANYDLLGKWGPWLLLKKRDLAKVISHHIIETRTISLGEYIKVPPDGLVYFEGAPQMTLLGLLRALFYQPAKVTASLRLADGSTKTYRAVLPLLQGGVPINKFAERTEQLQAYFEKKFNEMPAISQIRIDSTKDWAYKNRFQIRTSTIEIK